MNSGLENMFVMVSVTLFLSILGAEYDGIIAPGRFNVYPKKIYLVQPNHFVEWKKTYDSVERNFFEPTKVLLN